MSVLDGIIGGVVSAGVTALVKNLVEKNGGVQGIISQFEKSGFGEMAKSWVGTGANMPVNAEQIKSVLGADAITKLASSLGLPNDKIMAQISQHLPEYIDKQTPNGVIPAEDKVA